jgi:hypothetical protein
MTDPEKRIDKNALADTVDLDGPCPEKITLEGIVDSTGEFEHLNELIMLHLEKSGGFTGTDEYFRAVTPVLDLLEVEIRMRYVPGITRKQMKLVIQDWIDKEIAEIR